MSFLLDILGTAIAFATIMLAASLVVSTIVRIVLYVLNRRGKTLAEMLGTLNQSYRRTHGDHDLAAPGDNQQAAFVLDILGDPVLHTPDTLNRFTADASAPLARQQKLRTNLSRQVEYIAQDDLIRLIRSHATSGEIPPTWYGALPPQARSMESFVAHVQTWFRTVEGVSSEQFRKETRHLVAVISCIVVVLLNLDGLHLLGTLYTHAEVRDLLGSRSADLLASVTPASDPTKPQTDPDQLLSGTGADLARYNMLLNEPALELGWQHSWIFQKLCAYEKQCTEAPPGSPVAGRPSRLDWVMWLLGLGFSCVMLSLGAPFWQEQLSELLKLRSAIQTSKETPPTAPVPPNGAGAANAAAPPNPAPPNPAPPAP